MQVVLNEPLTQVVFVHDYFQLVFQNEILNVYSSTTLQVGATTFAQG